MSRGYPEKSLGSRTVQDKVLGLILGTCYVGLEGMTGAPLQDCRTLKNFQSELSKSNIANEL